MLLVDASVSATGNEGCDFHHTYMHAALIVDLQPEHPGGGGGGGGGGGASMDDIGAFDVAHTQRSYPYCGI